MIITCRECQKDVEKYEKAKGNICKPCALEYQRKYREANKDRLRDYFKARQEKLMKDPIFVSKNRLRGRQYWKALKHEVIMAYGGYRCNCCGESTPQFLTIDHVNNDGADHRRLLAGDCGGNGKGASGKTWKWLKEKGYPDGFQVLCMNCNFGKQINGGVCPHKANPKDKELREFGETLSETIPSQALNGKV